MTCTCCNDARHWPGTVAASRYTPACIYCGARLIQSIGTLRRPREELIERRRKVLADWMEHGHSEAEIRRLVKLGAVPLAPVSSESRPKRGG